VPSWPRLPGSRGVAQCCATLLVTAPAPSCSGIFRRLVEDGFHNDLPSILVTGACRYWHAHAPLPQVEGELHDKALPQVY
jgi:hypothetical protein